MELPLGCSYGQGRYTYEADASTAHEPEAAAGAGDLRPARVGVPERTAQQQQQIEALAVGLQKVSAAVELNKAAPTQVADNC